MGVAERELVGVVQVVVAANQETFGRCLVVNALEGASIVVEPRLQERAQGRQVGDLLSLNLPGSSGGSSGSSGFIPEPNSGVLAMLGLGLLGVGFAKRRKAVRN